jgi:methyl-accepting chemotaxis protein
LHNLGLRRGPDTDLVPRFSPNADRPDHLVASVVALADQANNLVLDAAMAAARAGSQGNLAEVVDQVCRAAVRSGVATGEVTWLVGELETLGTDAEELAEAGVAVAGMESCTRAVAQAVQELADRGGPAEIASSAEALRRVSLQLSALLPRLQPVG